MNKRYRPNVSAVILSSEYPKKCEIFIAKRIDMKDIWQFPQGGIDQGENPQEALKRELKEEIGTNAIEILAQYPQWINYDFPSSVAHKFYPFDGQSQKYFLVRLKSNALINIATPVPEFSEYAFVEFDKIFDRIKHFKKPIYKQVLDYFKKEGFLSC
ncbi:RNA pyrophosphohydrolase [Helicobacter kayseriensis]|uniref:RNA pyrophosphohydrolase n=1 Tax=Helicobacter kayseriensis TaxID=2905877 RepID=UPI001E44F583|nr:RNA pyrophosphohydrolase [Helicobacter kayseriensis]MCE3047711.1 RNA pyrophosphohydrolase [Helicobacter kayseriensis]MCE3049051.1 RNA pyrophosphohydrolase [Helicobacter kayseriensis]